MSGRQGQRQALNCAGLPSNRDEIFAHLDALILMGYGDVKPQSDIPAMIEAGFIPKPEPEDGEAERRECTYCGRKLTGRQWKACCLCARERDNDASRARRTRRRMAAKAAAA